jgi:tRNA(Glu) U13 pseudouridine synthase TruD
VSQRRQSILNSAFTKRLKSIYCQTPSNDDLGVWRVAVSELGWEAETGSALLRFRLGRGSFANAVLRELFDGISGVSDV